MEHVADLAIRGRPEMDSELEQTGIPCLLSINPQCAFCVDLNDADETVSKPLRIVHQNDALHNNRQLEKKINDVTGHDANFDQFCHWIYHSESSENVPTCDYAGRRWTYVTIQGRWRTVCVKDGHDSNEETTAANMPRLQTRISGSITTQNHYTLGGLEKSILESQLEDPITAAEEFKRHLMTAIDVVPVGIAIGNPDGTIVYANPLWYDIAGFDSNSPFPAGMFYACLMDDDRDMMESTWQNLITVGGPISYELKLKTRQDKNDHVDDRTREKWVLATSETEKDATGIVRFITTCITDITPQKIAEREAMSRAQVAEKLSQRLSHMKRMADTASVAMFDVTPQGDILGANDAFYTLMGLGKYRGTDHHIGMADWTDAIHDDDRAKALDNFARILQGENIDNILRIRNNPWIHDDGMGNIVMHERWLLNTAIPLTIPGSDEMSISCTLTDISAQKAQERSLAERADLLKQLLTTQERFSKFTANAPLGMSMIDPKGAIFFANATWNAMIPPDDCSVSDTPFLEAVHDDDRALVQESWAKVSSATKPMAETYSFRLKRIWQAPENKSLTHSWMQASSFPEFDEEGRLQSIMSCVNDISYYKWAEDIQKQRTSEALESKRQQENFIDMTSHEIRNPLSALIMCADVVVESLDAMKSSAVETRHIDTARDAMATIISCSQHQKRIVDDILTLSKLDARLLNITPVPSSARQVLKEAHKMFEAEASRLDIKFSCKVARSMDELKVDWVLMDPSRTMQVLINLCTNALKFTQKRATRAVHILLSASKEKPTSEPGGFRYMANTRAVLDDDTNGESIYLKFAVQDTGTGLTTEEISKLFKRFSQASIKTHTKYGGSGLGLWVSRELVEMSSGEIGVASESGAGSTFAFYILCKKTANPRQERTLANGISKTTISTAIAKLRVMIVEDNLINQAVLQKQLEKIGCVVTVANHGQQCLELLEETKFKRGNEKDGAALDIILMDVEMPIMDGLACTREIRSREEKGDLVGHVTIIAVSANARIEQIDTARAAGVDEVVVKPFRIPELMEKIYSILGQG